MKYIVVCEYPPDGTPGNTYSRSTFNTLEDAQAYERGVRMFGPEDCLQAVWIEDEQGEEISTTPKGWECCGGGCHA